MERKKFLNQYEKYVQAIKNCKDEDIPYNFKKFNDFINKEWKDENIDGELLMALEIGSVNAAIEELMKRDVPFKRVSTDWDSTAIAVWFAALYKLKEKKQEFFNNSSVITTVPDDIKILEAKVTRGINKAQDPSMKLFMFKQYRDNAAKKLFEYYSLELAKMLQCVGEETVCLEAK